jgi:Tol biopolymer transport system component
VYSRADPRLQFVWFDRSGKRLATAGDPGRYRAFELSPDDGRVAFEKLDNDGRNGNLSTLDLSRGFTTRLTTNAGSDWSPIWTPDGKSIIFGSSRQGFGDFYETPSAGGGGDRMILKSPAGNYAYSVSPDGKNLIYSVYGNGTKEDLWLLPLGGTEKPRPFRTTPFAEGWAQFSPDGRWVAFAADDSGRSEVYVRSVTDPSNQSRISSGGGVRPRWRRDGKELFFFSGAGLMAANVSPGSAFQAGEPRLLFKLRIWGDYAASKDGQRFLISTSPSETAEMTTVAVLNWTNAIHE